MFIKLFDLNFFGESDTDAAFEPAIMMTSVALICANLGLSGMTNIKHNNDGG